VTRPLPQLDIEDLRRDDLFVAVLTVLLAHELEQGVVDDGAARVEERARRRLGVKAEEIELTPELAVVAALELLDPFEVGVELFFRAERGAVEPLEHLVALVALEVGAGGLEEPHRADLTGPLEMGPATEIDEITVLVEGDRFALGDVLEADELDVLAPTSHDHADLVATDLGALEGKILGDDLAHLLLDAIEVFRFEGPREAEVVLVLLRVILAAGIDGSTRPQPFDSVRHDVLGGVADDIARLGVLDRHDPQRRILGEPGAQIHQPSIDLTGDGVVGEARADGGGHIEDR